MGEAVDQSFSHLAPEDIRGVVAYLRSIPAITSTDLQPTLAPPASASHRDGGGTTDPRGKMVFEGACVSCHGWSGESSISPFATLTDAWAVNDPGATNVAQIVISVTRRHTPNDAVSMPRAPPRNPHYCQAKSRSHNKRRLRGHPPACCPCLPSESSQSGRPDGSSSVVYKG
jgi:hypothetical protein